MVDPSDDAGEGARLSPIRARMPGVGRPVRAYRILLLLLLPVELGVPQGQPEPGTLAPWVAVGGKCPRAAGVASAVGRNTAHPRHER
eukprot:5922477-Prymnesium_polylepis.1